ncbi:MAG: hypothetical protein IH624_08995 [Phycisphaerae bacterium]|nr:hypothetical protein [Phycisphaerae bacterium]
MSNVFETPWLLLFVALVLLIIVWLIRQNLPEKRTWPLLLAPLAVAVLGGALEYFVKTDYERVESLMERGRRAAVHEDAAGFAEVLAPNYADRAHRSKAALVAFFESFFQTTQITHIRRTASQVVITPPSATAECVYRVQLAPGSAYSQAASMYYVKLRFHFAQQADGGWLIDGANLLEVNFQPMGWGDI